VNRFSWLPIPVGGFKQLDPTVAVDKLKAKWVAGAHVIYIGKADLASRRLAEFAKFTRLQLPYCCRG
jgi:hypothetical protein